MVVVMMPRSFAMSRHTMVPTMMPMGMPTSRPSVVMVDACQAMVRVVDVAEIQGS